MNHGHRWAVLGVLFAFAAGAAASPAWPTDFTAAAPNVEITAKPSHTTVAPGQAFQVAVIVTIREGQWLYSPTPRGTIAPPRPLAITGAGEGLAVGPTLYPRPSWHTIAIGEITDSNLVYENRLVAYLPITVNAGAADGPRELRVTLSGQTCDEQGCYDAAVETEVTVTVGPTPAAAAEGAFPAPPQTLLTADAWDARLGQTPQDAAPPAAGAPGAGLAAWAALALALLAGAALNVMPCVLPVIPIKIMSLLQQAGHDRRRSITLGLAYAGGIFGFFLLGAAASVALRLTTGAIFNLDDPFGVPGFVIAMALLLVGAALWLFDVFTLGAGFGFAPSAQRSWRGHAGSAAMGFFTAVLATPCSGPVLATVFGWAQGQAAWAAGAIFAALGLGMAAPHALLAAFPGLLNRIPKPGPWMQHLKQGMAFILLLVAAWLISTLGEVAWVGWVTAYAVVLAGCLWMAGTWVTFQTPSRKRRIVRLTAATIAVGAGLWMLPRPTAPAIAWRPFDATAIEAARAEGKVVLVKFTAETCTLCKILDLRLYNRESTASALAERGVEPFEADTTRRTSPANRMLTDRLGEPGPPVTLIYGPGVSEPIRLHGVFSLDELLEAVDKAAAKP